VITLDTKLSDLISEMASAIRIRAAEEMEHFCRLYEGVGHYIEDQNDFEFDGLEITFDQVIVIFTRSTLRTCFGKALAVVEIVSSSGQMRVRGDSLAPELVNDDGLEYLIQVLLRKYRGAGVR